MSKVKNAIEVSFSNIEHSPFKDNEILSLEVNEGISISFIAKLKFCSKVKLTKDKLKALLTADLKITVKQSDADSTTTRDRIFKGIVVSFQDLGIYQQITENSQKTFIYAYELTLMPEIVKLGYKKHNRSFENKTLDEVLDTVFKEQNLIVDTAEDNIDPQLWVEKPAIEELVLSQSQESDLEFVNELLRSFGLNFNVIYDRKRSNNKYVFSRGWSVDTGAKVYENKSTFQGNELGQDISSSVIEANYFDGKDSFEEHFVYDLKSDGSVDFESSLNEEEKVASSLNLNNCLTMGNLSDKRKNEICSYFDSSDFCLKKSLTEKVIVKVSDLVYTPGSKFSLKAYSDNEKFIIVRDVFSVKVKNTDYNNPEYELSQTCLALTVKQNDEKRKILGSVVDVVRLNHNSNLNDCVLVPIDNKSGATVALSQSQVSNASYSTDSIFVIGTVCDKDCKTANYKDADNKNVSLENTIYPVSSGEKSIPTKFYLKVKDSTTNTPVVVEYLNPVSGNTSNYLSSFPRVGQRVVALKSNNTYFFYAYLPQEEDIDVFDETLRKSNMSGTSLIDYKDTIENFSDYDIGLKGLDFKHFSSIKEKLRYLILNDDVDNFMYGVSIRKNDLSIYENFYDKKTTVKQLYPSEDYVQIASKCLSLPNELKQNRNSYRVALKEGKAVTDSDEKKNLENVYKDLTTVAEKLMQIISKTDSIKDAEDKLKGIFSTTLSTLNSDGDLKLAAKNDLEIDANNLTLRVKGRINISADGGINLLSGKNIILNSGCSSLVVAPSAISSKVRRVWCVDLPYDSGMNITNTGISMTGFSVNMASLLSSSIQDGFGGKVSLSQGKANISGSHISITTPAKQAVALNSAVLLKNLLGLLNIATALSDNKGAKISVAMIQNLAPTPIKIVQGVLNYKKNKQEFQDQEIDYASLILSTVTDSVDVLLSAYELVEAVVMAHFDENGKYYKNYTERNRSNNYISPQEWVKLSIFYLKSVVSMIPAVAASFSIFKDGKSSKLKVLSDKIKFDSELFENKSKFNRFYNSSLDGVALPLPDPDMDDSVIIENPQVGEQDENNEYDNEHGEENAGEHDQ